MSASVGEEAKKLGERLLAEVEVEDLSSVRCFSFNNLFEE